MNEKIQPRIIRLKDAPFYLGIDKNTFNRDIRPTITEIPIGNRAIAFDRLDLDRWVEKHKDNKGRKPLTLPTQAVSENVLGKAECKTSPDSTSEAISGISIKPSEASRFAAALTRATSTRRSRS